LFNRKLIKFTERTIGTLAEAKVQLFALSGKMVLLGGLIQAITRKPIISGKLFETNAPVAPPVGGSASPKEEKSKAKLKRSLHLRDLIFYGVGCSVGAGIYSLVVSDGSPNVSFVATQTFF
jgi:hypothetical protein